MPRSVAGNGRNVGPPAESGKPLAGRGGGDVLPVRGPVGEVVLGMLLAGADPVLDSLRAQCALARVVRRERTKVGFFEIFEVAQARPLLDAVPDFVLDDVAAELEGVDGVARFLLSICDGSLDFLEGAMIGSRWPASPRIRRAYYLTPAPAGSRVIVETGTRDLAALRTRWAG